MIVTARRFSGGKKAGAEIEAHQGSPLRDLANKMRDTLCRCPSPRAFLPRLGPPAKAARSFFQLAWNPLQSPADATAGSQLAPIELTIVIELASSLGLAAWPVSRLELMLGRPP
jgi:hypothetical protein